MPDDDEIEGAGRGRDVAQTDDKNNEPPILDILPKVDTFEKKQVSDNQKEQKTKASVSDGLKQPKGNTALSFINNERKTSIKTKSKESENQTAANNTTTKTNKSFSETVKAANDKRHFENETAINGGVFSLTTPQYKDFTFLLTDEELDTIQNMTLDIEIYQDFLGFKSVKGRDDFKDIDEFLTTWMNNYPPVACDPDKDCQKWREHMPFSYPGHKSRAVKIEYWGEINSGDVGIDEDLRKEMVASLGDKYKGDDVLEYDRILRENFMQYIENITTLTNVTDYYFIEYQQNNRRKYLVMKCFYKIQGIVGEDPAFKKKWDDRHKKCEETAQSIKFRNLDIQKK